MTFIFSKSYFLVRQFSPQIWQQTVRHRGKFNVKVPHPRHNIARYLEELTKPVLSKTKYVLDKT